MSRGQKPQANLAPNYEASRAAASRPSPYEERVGRMTNEVLDWAAAGDYRVKPKGIVFNFADPAERARRRALMANSRGQGVSAFGAEGNATVLALDKQHRDAENERDDAASYEQDVSQGVARAAGMAGDLAQMDNARRMGVLSSDAGLYGSFLQRPEKPRWWERLISNGQEGARTAAMAGGG